jgi:hypothetical protein
MSKSVTSLWSIFALLSAAIVTIPASAQAQRCVGKYCARPSGGTSVSTSYRYRTVPRISNVNRYRNVTRTNYRDVTRTAYRNIRRVRYRDITRTHYVRHINRIVTVTRVQPVVRVHTVTRVHRLVLTRVHTRVIPRVYVAVIPRYRTRTVMLTQTQHVAQTRMLPTRYAMGSSRTIAGGTRMARIPGRTLYSYVRPAGSYGRPMRSRPQY